MAATSSSVALAATAAGESKDTKYVFNFGELDDVKRRLGNPTDWVVVKSFLGGKGAGLCQMVSLGLPVPPGFVISTEACTKFLANTVNKGEFPAGMWEQVVAGVRTLEQQTKKKFGRDLFVACRSGARDSMPGMMDTVLNIGLNDESARSFAKLTNERFVQDSYRRLIQGFSGIVLDVPHEHYEHFLKEYKKKKGYALDTDMKAEDWVEVVAAYKQITRQVSGRDFPQDPMEQLRLSVRAVFNSWNSKRAFAYRDRMKISHSLGTACSIVTMVFGNMSGNSGTGVAFTRNPSTGERKLYGEYLVNAQGEDVVAGVRTPSSVSTMGNDLPDAYRQLLQVAEKLEQFFKNMQDIEFTVERGTLYMLQTRDGKRTAKAQVKIACDMVAEGLIGKEEAVKRVSADDINTLLLPQLDPAEIAKAKREGREIAKGVNASPGGAVGKVVFDADTAVEKQKHGEASILVRPFTKPDDVHGFFASKGILTAEGGATSHAAVVARQFGLPCIVGAAAINVDLKNRKMTVPGAGGKVVTVNEGEWISLDATTGYVYLGHVTTIAADFNKQTELKQILQWADEITSAPGSREGGRPGLQVWANADYGKDAANARRFGAKGIGLCRTEHMFFEKDRLPIVQEMILAKTDALRQAALDRILPFQRKDFIDLFTAMDGLPVIIRLIDPPLHEFLPEEKDLVNQLHKLELAGKQNTSEYAEKKKLLHVVEEMHESNPMLGLRGCRLGIMMPQILTMQARAIFEAAVEVSKKGIVVKPKVMIPLVAHVNELKLIRPAIDAAAKAVFGAAGQTIKFDYGTMVETPRAALTAGEIAQEAEFFSFGTNDLTQMAYGIARDDAERKFLVHYVTEGVLPGNPFQTLDTKGVGQLIDLTVRNGRATRPGMSIGICGEVGGDPATIQFCHQTGLDYVSCSAFRVPVARLAAAHAVISNRGKKPAAAATPRAKL